tara:strand:+ start:665 stop:1360 length:696 start_codon:yes stop_codon:yes gene_type:complete
MKKIDKIKKELYKANQDLINKKLVIQSFGNVSVRLGDCIFIKPSGVNLSKLDYKSMVPVNLSDKKYTGSFKPSSDTPTHIELYKKYNNIQSVVHTHSTYATSWAQAGIPIPCFGTTHADFWADKIPVTRKLKKKEIEADYEKNTGLVIIETLEKLNTTPLNCPGVLVNNHGVFTWGKSAHDAIKNAEALEIIAKIALNSSVINPNIKPINKNLHNKHFYRKHGNNKYYGQK